MTLIIGSPKLTIIPLPLDEANAFVRQHHRHHKPVPGAKFCLGVATEDGRVVGVAIVGRPVARMLDDGWTLEVNRTCTNGTRNANSMLYGACRRAAFALGYRRLMTYTLPEESGVSLRAAGWRCLGQAGGGSWNRRDRPRVDTHPLQIKLKWEAVRAEATEKEDSMDSVSASIRGEANRGEELMVFDWEKAAKIIKERGAKFASAGLSGYWDRTGVTILANGKPISRKEAYTYLASTWAAPELEIAGEIIECYRMQSETPGWDKDTFWPEEAVKLLWEHDAHAQDLSPPQD